MMGSACGVDGLPALTPPRVTATTCCEVNFSSPQLMKSRFNSSVCSPVVVSASATRRSDTGRVLLTPMSPTLTTLLPTVGAKFLFSLLTVTSVRRAAPVPVLRTSKVNVNGSPAVMVSGSVATLSITNCGMPGFGWVVGVGVGGAAATLIPTVSLEV